MSETRWEHFAHEADMDLRGFGENKAEAFQQAALAMTAVITDLDAFAADHPYQPLREH